MDEHQEAIKIKVRITEYKKELKALEQLYFNKKAEIQRFHLLASNALKGKELTKGEMLGSTLYKDRKTQKITKDKSTKTPTAEVSFELYQQGKSIEEIAETRGLVPSTIEGHLTKYISSGEVDIKRLISETKLNNILSLITPETTGTQEIKNKLGDDYSYGEIRMALAFYKK